MRGREKDVTGPRDTKSAGGEIAGGIVRKRSI